MPSEFLVEIEIETGNLASDKVEDLRNAEAVQARELARLGHLVTLWRIPGRWANYGIWRAADREHLSQILGTLPLRPYMRVGIQDLERHPSDPRPPVVGASDNSRIRRTWDLPALEPLKLEGRGFRPPIRRWQLDPLPELSLERRGRRELPVRAPAEVQQLVGTAHVVAGVDMDVTALLSGRSKTETDVIVLKAVAAAAAGTVVTHSGAQGLHMCSSLPTDARIAIDVGIVTRQPRARTLTDGTEVIQVRSIARLTLTAAAGTSDEEAGILLVRLVSRMEESQELHKKEAP
ncbi:muconolactone Delta-isomerase family protein [Paenarthrobacter sp. NPDC091669]|uniref:muconolactone Delta-isomerase family protein n=1 Tax=Paenarthrobacter sp. NPDC091669 TaxID=3364384 RepID=UPI00381A837B